MSTYSKANGNGRKCSACSCETYEDEGSYCQDCYGVIGMPNNTRRQERSLTLVRRLHYLRLRAELGLPLFEGEYHGRIR